MKALIKSTDKGMTIITEPFPAWLDPVAFSVFDCYGYAYCAEYDAEGGDTFTFEKNEIPNPFKQSEDDPDTVLRHIARQIR